MYDTLAQAAGSSQLTLYSALTAAAAAIVSSVVASVVALRTTRQKIDQDYLLKRLESRASIEKDDFAFRRRQLDEFYGRAYMLRRKSESLRSLLPRIDASGCRWSLVDNVEQVRLSSDKRKIGAVEAILEIGDELSELITTNASLYDVFPPPASFSQFVKHHALLRLAWHQKKNQDEGERLPFPVEIDDDLDNAIARIRQRIAETLKQE